MTKKPPRYATWASVNGGMRDPKRADRWFWRFVFLCFVVGILLAVKR